MLSCTTFSVLSLVMLGVMGVVFFRSWYYSKAVIPVYLIGVITMLFAHNGISVYSYITMTSVFPEALAPYFFGIDVTEFAGIGLWMYTIWK